MFDRVSNTPLRCFTAYWVRSSHRMCSMQKQTPEVFCKKVVLKNFAKFTGKHLCQSLFFNKVADLRPATPPSDCFCLWKRFSEKFYKIHRKTPVPPYNFIKSETLSQVFSRAFCEIFKVTFFTEHLRATASIRS